MVQGKGFGIQMIYCILKKFRFIYVKYFIFNLSTTSVYSYNVIPKCTGIRRIAQTNYATSVKKYLCRNRIGLP